MAHTYVCMAMGAGGTGKSTFLTKLKDEIEKNYKNIDVVFVPSVVRGFYAQRGVKDQAAFLTMPKDERRQFQIDLLRHYMDETQKVLSAEYENHTVLLFDRSPCDHIAYTVDSSEITLAEFSEFIQSAKGILKQVDLLLRFPYPAFFTKEVDPDPFRVAHPSQNIKIAALMDYVLNKCNPEAMYGVITVDSSTVEDIDESFRIIYDTIEDGFLTEMSRLDKKVNF